MIVYLPHDAYDTLPGDKMAVKLRCCPRFFAAADAYGSAVAVPGAGKAKAQPSRNPLMTVTAFARRRIPRVHEQRSRMT